MKNKTLWKQVGSGTIAAAMVMSTVPATPVQAAGGKTLAVSSQKQLNQALKTVKGKNAVITVKAGKNVKITIPKGTYIPSRCYPFHDPFLIDNRSLSC